MESKRFSESLVCHLTPEEVAERADRAARLQHDADELAAELARETKTYKGRISRATTEQHRLLEEVRTRQGYQPVECERQPDLLGGILRTVRLDTGEIVRTRALTPEERQKKLFVDDDYPYGGEAELEELGVEEDETEAVDLPGDGAEPAEAAIEEEAR